MGDAIEVEGVPDEGEFCVRACVRVKSDVSVGIVAVSRLDWIDCANLPVMFQALWAFLQGLIRFLWSYVRGNSLAKSQSILYP